MPPEYKSRMREMGVVGGISAAVSLSIMWDEVVKGTDVKIASSYYRYSGFLHSSVSD